MVFMTTATCEGRYDQTERVNNIVITFSVIKEVKSEYIDIYNEEYEQHEEE